VSASVNLPLHHKVQKFSSGTGSPGWSRKRGRKTVVMVWCQVNLGQRFFSVFFLRRTFWYKYSLVIGLVFCCYQQVYDILTSCLWVILQVRGRDGMSTLQNGAAAYSQSHVFARLVSCCLPCSFRLPECPSPMVDPLLSAEAFLWPLSLASSQLLMQTPRVPNCEMLLG